MPDGMFSPEHLANIAIFIAAFIVGTVVILGSAVLSCEVSYRLFGNPWPGMVVWGVLLVLVIAIFSTEP